MSRTAWHPVPRNRHEQRTIPLANGAGHVTTDVEASADPRTGLLATLTRKVTTDLGGDGRVVREEWTLKPLPEGAQP